MTRRARRHPQPSDAERAEWARKRAAEERREAARAWVLEVAESGPSAAADPLLWAIRVAHRDVSSRAEAIRAEAHGLATHALPRIIAAVARGSVPVALRSRLDEHIAALDAAVYHREALVSVYLDLHLTEAPDA